MINAAEQDALAQVRLQLQRGCTLDARAVQLLVGALEAEMERNRELRRALAACDGYGGKKGGR